MNGELKRVQLFYGHVASNWGDLAINQGVVELLKRCPVDLDRSVAMVRSPNDTHLLAGIDSLAELTVRFFPPEPIPHKSVAEVSALTSYYSDPRQFVEDVGMEDYDVVLINSGEHFFETQRGDNLLDLLWRLLPAVAADVAGKPVILLPSTFGPFRTALGESVRAFMTEGVSSAAFRESASQWLNRRVGGAALPLCLDPAFFIPTQTRNRHQVGNNSVVSIVFRLEDSGLRAGSRRSAYVKQKFRDKGYETSQAYKVFYALARKHIELGKSIRIIVQTSADRDVSLTLFDNLVKEYPDSNIMFSDPENLEDFLDDLLDSEKVFTSRFHSYILSASGNVPVVGVYSAAHGHKMPGLIKSLRMPYDAVRIDDRATDVIVEEALSVANCLKAQARSTRWLIAKRRQKTTDWLTTALNSKGNHPTELTDLRFRACLALFHKGIEYARKEAAP